MPARKRSRPAPSRRTPARKPSRKPSRKAARQSARAQAPKPARKPARKLSRKPSRAAARAATPKAARKAARKVARKAAPKAARKAARKVARKAAPKAARKAARKVARQQARATKPKRAVRPPKTRRPARGVATLPVPPVRARGPKRRRRTPKPPEIVPPIVIEDEPPGPAILEAAATPAEISDGEQLPDTRRYVAVVSEIEGTETFPVQQAPLLPRRQEREEAESYPTDIPIALGAALLAASIFLPWYKGPPGVTVSVTGWESGTLAPLLLFLAAGSLILVALRRGGAAASLPIEESLAHEAAGWLALVAAVVKSRWRPSIGFQLTPSYGLWIAIGAAALLVVLAGRMSPRAPLVMRPGWYRARGGALGAALLLLVVAGATVFGLVNSPSGSTASSNPDLFRGTVRDRIPDCAKDFPLPAGLKPELGFDTGSTCQAQLTSTQGSTALIQGARTSLTNAKWTFTEVKGAAGSSVFSITKPRCATLAVVPTERGSLVALAYTRCMSPTPTPSPTGS